MFHRTYVEKKTTSEGGSLLLLCGPNRLNSDMSGLVAGTFTPESHLTSLEVHFPHHVHLCPCCSKKEEPYMNNPSLGGKFSILFDPPYLKRYRLIPSPQGLFSRLLMGTKAFLKCLVRQVAVTLWRSSSLIHVPAAGPSGKRASPLSPSLKMPSVSHGNYHNQEDDNILTTGTVPPSSGGWSQGTTTKPNHVQEHRRS